VGAGIGLVVVWLALGALLELGFVGHLLTGLLMVAVFQGLVLRRSLRTLLARDSATIAHRWPGKVLVTAVLVVIPTSMVLLSVVGDRYGRYADDSWKALLMLVALAGSYLATRRLLLTVLIGAVTVAMASWVLAPNLAQTRNGDPTVLAHLDYQASMGWLAGYHSVAVAEVDLDAAKQVRLAGIGADHTAVMEVGSMTKAMTGLVIADAVDRGEVRMDAPVSTYLPQLKGSSAGTATMHELVTHTAGYREFGAATLRSAAWKAPLGLGFLTADGQQMTNETRELTLSDRGRYAYSTLGSAIAGQAVAAAAHLNYPDLMRTRLFEPLGMSHTAIEVDRPLVEGGTSQTGLPVQPWVMDAYAPGAAAVSTTADLAKLATALLDGTAPGMSALEPTTATDKSNTRIGGFWWVSTWSNGQTITAHAGQTGGYASYLGIDRARHKAVIVLSDVANNANDLGIELLIDHE
jgi:CubicO group peptidase (beta-lactamase class C family)